MALLRVMFLAVLPIPCVVAAQVSNQSFQVTPEVDRATVGDLVTLRFRVRLDERDLLFDTIPQPWLPFRPVSGFSQSTSWPERRTGSFTAGPGWHSTAPGAGQCRSSPCPSCAR